MIYDFAYSGRFLRNGRFMDLEVGISDGIIRKIGKNLQAHKKMQLEGAILPAGTDTHVHFRDPWETEKEDFSTGSLSALYGGTTTVFDMPNNRLPVADYDVYERKLNAIRRRSYVDYGLYSMFTGRNADIIEPESSAIKIFLGGSTNSVEIEDIDSDQVSSLNDLEVPVVFHAEDGSCLSEQGIVSRDLKSHNLARPEICESRGIESVLKFQLNRKVVTHLTVSSELEKLRGKVTTEVTPHHMLLNEEFESSPYRRVNPPLRSRESQEKLLDHYLRGHIDIVSSDHAPHTEYDKESFEFGKSGIIGVETRIPVLLSLVSRKILDLNILVRTACEAPASLMGIKKGRIEQGYSADFMAVHFSDKRKLRDRYLHSKNPQTPFEGLEVIFPHSVIMRGEPVLYNSEAVDDKVGSYIHDLREEHIIGKKKTNREGSE